MGHKLHQLWRSLRKKNGFSRFEEERILARYINQLLLLPSGQGRTAVDIGAGDGIRWSNTHALFLEGWNGLAIEADSKKFGKLRRTYRTCPRVSTCNEPVTPDRIAPLLRSYKIEKGFEVLSLDIDGNDYWVLQSILEEFRPQLIVAEINEKIPPPLRFITKYDPEFRLRHHFYGFSIMSLADLCHRYDYAILEVEYNNAFMAPKELALEGAVDPETAYRAGYMDRPDRKEKFPLNFDLDEVRSLPTDKALIYLNNFYAKERGKYYLGAEPIKEAL